MGAKRALQCTVPGVPKPVRSRGMSTRACKVSFEGSVGNYELEKTILTF